MIGPTSDYDEKGFKFNTHDLIECLSKRVD